MSTILDRPLPHSIEAETSVLGAILLDNSLIQKAMQMFGDKQVFYVKKNQMIYDAMIELHDKRLPIDLTNLRYSLKENGFLDSVDESYLLSLEDSVPHAMSFDFYANEVLKLFNNRRKIELCTVVIQGAYSGVNTAASELIKLLENRKSDCIEKREKTLSEEVKEWVLSSSGVFLSSDVSKSLQVSSRDEQKNLSKILSRLCEDGAIERFGSKNGCFRRVERDYEVINFTDTRVEHLPIVWPFNLHEKVYTLPKSLAIIAGQTDAGKSAFCLNFAYLNRNQGKIRYLTSEMGSQEIKSRVSLMGVPIETWNQIEFIERSGQFQDLVLPEGITIIDYLEKAENFYEIAKDIKGVFDRLKTGFCLIAIQKKEGQDFGRGGDFSAEKRGCI